jgi:hypothetical protein
MITKPKPELEPVYTPMSEADMDAELDRIEASEADAEPHEPK